ncbi:condensin complex protein MksE [Tenacibaculum maritimum]|uniref:condensin complex protein MksE n=1 Tax=Tenacibaculum maritimum TaxID=107401 RepID=UPI0012E62898|nr:hypothetical protein [Tenacibaculum maritimum]MDB0602882.1 hypothetical protein [Tenacibaculum maritimum]MDB0613660.1 hypothetical protein [Tenacibaculum maritimum]CAA0212768.1 conserved hypothetical protein [Tenacibaculum maritimum]
MENGSTQTTISDFLKSENTRELFSKVDYKLKDGVHIQQYGNQIDLYNYIVENEESLKLYYNELFKVSLSSGGEYPDKYFYLDFDDPNSRGNISNNHRHYLKNEYIIIGFIIYEIIGIQKEIDLFSVSELKRKIRIDYEDIKPGLYRLIAKSKNTNPGKLNDTTIDSTVKSALTEFKKIGWIRVKDDEFELLPAFDRLIDFYENEIQNIEDIYKELT